MDIFHNPTKSVPTKDGLIVRVDMEEQQIGGRKSHLPAKHMESDLSISHVPSPAAGSGS
jgi:YbbR domain-containing protein